MKALIGMDGLMSIEANVGRNDVESDVAKDEIIEKI
jgi:hypothetical protein